MNFSRVIRDAFIAVGLVIAIIIVIFNDTSFSEQQPIPEPTGTEVANNRPGSLLSPYTEYKGKQNIPQAKKDQFGNAEGSKYDLGRDGAFEGLQIAVLHLYTGQGFDFELPKAALAVKGFSIHRWTDNPPSPDELERVLKDSCQLWIISDRRQKLNEDHLKVIHTFFNQGRGIFIWGDNNPFYTDANYVSHALLGVGMSGDSPGDQIVQAQTQENGPGIVSKHWICTGIVNLYEGQTIATLDKNNDLDPILYGSAGNLVVAGYDRKGRRALLDGGFTRLFIKWDTAGTARYVKNAAAWLVNYDRFGRSVFFSTELAESVARLREGSRDELIDALSSPNTVERIAAIVTTQEKKLSLFKELIVLLNDDAIEVRQEAHKALVALANGMDYGPSEEADLAEIERSAEQWSKWNIRRVHLVEFMLLSADDLIALFDDTDPVKRWAAVSAFRNRQLVIDEKLLNLVRDADADVCDEVRLTLVASAGGEYDYGPQPGEPDAAKNEAFARWTKLWQREQVTQGFRSLEQGALLDKLTSPAPLDRWAALTVLRRRGNVSPERLLNLLRDEDNEVRQEARRALVSLGNGADYGPQDQAREADIAMAADRWNAWWVEAKAHVEELAQNRLRMAKTVLEVNKERGQSRLEEIVNEFAGTSAASEAQQILNEN
jgi:hypothetical protein